MHSHSLRDALALKKKARGFSRFCSLYTHSCPQAENAKPEMPKDLEPPEPQDEASNFCRPCYPYDKMPVNKYEGLVCRKCFAPVETTEEGTLQKGWAGSGRAGTNLKCPSCNSLCTQLAKAGESLKPFQNIEVSVAAEWFRKMRGQSGKVLKEEFTKFLEYEEKRTSFKKNTGSYLPKGVYIAQGWPEAVVDACQDTWDHPTLGHLIRLEIHSRGDAEEKTERELEQCESRAKPGRKASAKVHRERKIAVPKPDSDPADWDPAQRDAFASWVQEDLDKREKGYRTLSSDENFQQAYPPQIVTRCNDCVEKLGTVKAAFSTKGAVATEALKANVEAFNKLVEADKEFTAEMKMISKCVRTPVSLPCTKAKAKANAKTA